MQRCNRISLDTETGTAHPGGNAGSLEFIVSPSSETQRLIDLTLSRLRREMDKPSALHFAAWGTEEGPLDMTRLGGLAGDLPPAVTLDPSALQGAGAFNPLRARILLNLLILAAASLPCGGTIQLLGSADDLFLRIDGPMAAWPAGLAACLADAAAARAALAAGDSRLMPLIALLAHAAGIRLSFLLSARDQSEPAILHLGG
ncbi:MAG: hypothetical protein JSS43_03705 [Proteobacteria bacterium]|nr:hypothetical protein [Pseudomonadota bacterium]